MMPAPRTICQVKRSIVFMAKEKGHPLQGAPRRFQGLALRRKHFVNLLKDFALVYPVVNRRDDL